MDMQLLVKIQRLDKSIRTQILRERKGTIYQIKLSSVHTREDELLEFTGHVHRCPSELPIAVQCKLRKARELNNPLVGSRREEAIGPRCNWPKIEIEDSETMENIQNVGGKSLLVAFQVTPGIHCVPWARRQRFSRWGSEDLDRPYNRQRLLQYSVDLAAQNMYGEHFCEIGRHRLGVNPGRQNYADPASAESATPSRQMSTDVSPSRQGGWTGSGNAVIGCQFCSEFRSPVDEEMLKIVLGHVLSGVKERVTVATPGKCMCNDHAEIGQADLKLRCYCRTL
ncbi:hypothetical protein B0H14DRAFT_2578203 [Mycena olivaceomarginata]|nr:hypothetical protein B0H14DRAFT_2578203 [Mycena olivaceomarginata]